VNPARIAIVDGGYRSYRIETEGAAAVGAVIDVRQCRDEDEVAEFARDAVAIMARQSRLSRRVIERLGQCRVIARYGTGVDNVDLEAATQHGIVVANVIGFGTHEVAEHAIALLLAGARRIVSHDRAVRGGAWDIGQADPIGRITGSTLGLIGYGAIARAVQRKLSGFELRTLVHDPFVDDDLVRDAGATPVGLDELLREADLVSLHAPLQRSTYHLLDARALALLKPSAVLVNTARGGLIDTDALVAALDEGRIAAVGLDVHEEEPLPPGHPIRECERAILLDHAGWYSEDSTRALQQGAIDAVVAVLQGRRPASVVNLDVYDRAARGPGSDEG
jgi:D-3-phosphoglycerate dehydrogenase / 2-oxoglutarate reductase